MASSGAVAAPSSPSTGSVQTRMTVAAGEDGSSRSIAGSGKITFDATVLQYIGRSTDGLQFAKKPRHETVGDQRSACCRSPERGGAACPVLLSRGLADRRRRSLRVAGVVCRSPRL